MNLPEEVYMVRMHEEVMKRLPHDTDDSNIHLATTHYKRLANKYSAAPALYSLKGAKSAMRAWYRKDNEYFSYKFDIVPVFIKLGDPI